MANASLQDKLAEAQQLLKEATKLVTAQEQEIARMKARGLCEPGQSEGERSAEIFLGQ